MMHVPLPPCTVGTPSFALLACSAYASQQQLHTVLATATGSPCLTSKDAPQDDQRQSSEPSGSSEASGPAVDPSPVIALLDDIGRDHFSTQSQDSGSASPQTAQAATQKSASEVRGCEACSGSVQRAWHRLDHLMTGWQLTMSAAHSWAYRALGLSTRWAASVYNGLGVRGLWHGRSVD